MTDFPCLETARLRLREVRRDDAEDLVAIYGDRVHMRWVGSDPLPDLAAARHEIEQILDAQARGFPDRRWCIERRGAPSVIGTCSLMNWQPAWRRSALGYALGAPCTGQGFMGEALQAVLAWAFTDAGLHRVEAMVHALNSPSLRVLQRLGFVNEGRLREVAYWGGRRHDLQQFSLLRQEWLGRTPPPRVPAWSAAAQQARC